MGVLKHVGNGNRNYFCLDNSFYSNKNINEILNDKEIYFYWDKTITTPIKNSIDLKDVFNFYRIFEIDEFTSLFSHQEFANYFAVKKQIKNILYSYKRIGVNTKAYEAYDLIPDYIIKDFFNLEVEVLRKAKNYIEKKSWYNKLITFFLIFEQINVLRDLNYQIKTTEGFKGVSLLWQANFRFKSYPGYFNLFNLKKEDRDIIIPQDSDHILYHADFRQFEIRTLLSLIPDLDIDFEEKDLYVNFAKKYNLDPKEAKIDIIAYSYGKENKKLENIINKQSILENIINELYVWNNYPVVVREEDKENVKLHTIVQTISQYKYLEKLQKILLLLKGKESKFIYPHHDSVIISISKKELDIIPEIRKILEDDVYKIHECVGKNFKEMSTL